ncbi:MAG: DnaB-like helicase C-terminal domain-containing protein, partial [Candidatus Zixiibacteriota bacterium]
GRHENRQQEISAISRNMKVLAKELDIPVIACSQLSRMVEQRGGEKRPQLSDLRESGAIEQDADVVMFVYRAEHYLVHLDRNDPKYLEAEGKAEIIISKQRNGPTGIVPLAFIKDFARFENLAPEYRELPSGAEPVSGEDMPF